jgi:hypothetical protein
MHAAAVGDNSPGGKVSHEPGRVVYWFRDLPPLDGEPSGEDQVEAVSTRFHGRLEHADDLWDRCRDEVLAVATTRIEQEVARLGARYARVTDEELDSRHDDAANESYLHGRFRFVVYR